MTVVHTASSKLPTPFGEFKIHTFQDINSRKEHVALTMGSFGDDESVLARVHSECFTGDIFSSLRCDCGEQLKIALKAISNYGKGAVLYLKQEGRGIGLSNKIKAYSLQDTGLDTVEANEKLGFEADMRNYDMCLPMLQFLNIRKIRLMTNNPRKIRALQQLDIEITERIPLKTKGNPHNERYLATKLDKLGHLLKDE